MPARMARKALVAARNALRLAAFGKEIITGSFFIASQVVYYYTENGLKL
jgi:hypothetical protein